MENHEETDQQIAVPLSDNGWIDCSFLIRGPLVRLLALPPSALAAVAPTTVAEAIAMRLVATALGEKFAVPDSTEACRAIWDVL